MIRSLRSTPRQTRASEGTLSERVQGVTQILVSHRILTLLGCERVLVLEHGRVKQLGTPEELLQQEGLFREIYQAQMAVGEEEPA